MTILTVLYMNCGNSLRTGGLLPDCMCSGIVELAT